MNGETNLLELGLSGRISLDKGCYLGQETMAKLVGKAGVKQQLRCWSSDRPCNPVISSRLERIEPEPSPAPSPWPPRARSGSLWCAASFGSPSVEGLTATFSCRSRQRFRILQPDPGDKANLRQPRWHGNRPGCTEKSNAEHGNCRETRVLPLPMPPPEQGMGPIHTALSPLKTLPGRHRLQAIAAEGSRQWLRIRAWTSTRR